MGPPQENTLGKQLSKSNKDSLPSGGQGVGSYLERKEILKKKSRLEKSVKEVERKIEALEDRIKELDAILCTPEGASDMTVVTEYTSTKKLIDQETERWAQLSEELEGIEL
jgi:ATP-binding cassette subfamily F protein 3